MKKTISFALVCVALSAIAAIMRFTSAPLSRSVQNEADAAIDRGCAWLTAIQSADGSWNGDCETTAIAMLALAGSGEPISGVETGAITRAASWLRDAPRPEKASAVSWRDMALAVFAPDALEAPRSPLPFPDKWHTTDKAALFEACAIRERQKLLGITDDASLSCPCTNDFTFALLCLDGEEPGSKALRELALRIADSQYSLVVRSNPEHAWWFAHAVNSRLGGNLSGYQSGDVEFSDWRGDLAGACTTSQTIDERGRGHWENSIRSTAFSVLLLKEL